MFRKLILALSATAALGAAVLVPTAATAGGWHGHRHHWHHGWHRPWPAYGVGFYGPTFVAAPVCYRVKRLVDTPYGPRWRRVRVCG